MATLPLILGMSGGEIAFILFVFIMIFGADKIPEIARNLGKGIKTVRNATNDIKAEITKSSDKSSVMKDNATKDLKEEVSKMKEDIEKITGPIKRKF